jgi:hypothetical protein
MARDWRTAQGLDEYEAYKESRRRQETRETAADLRQSRDDVAYEMFVAKFEDRRLMQADLDDGWLPAPRYISRADEARLAGAECRYDRHGQLMAYRLPAN